MHTQYHVRDFLVNTRVLPVSGVITIVSTFGERLKSARLEAGLSQAALADAAGFKSQGAIANMEAGRPGSHGIGSLAHALGVEAYWLETGKGPRRRTTIEAFDLLPEEHRITVELALYRIAQDQVPETFVNATMANLRAIASMPSTPYVVAREPPAKTPIALLPKKSRAATRQRTRSK